MEAFNIEILDLLTLHRVPSSRDSIKGNKVVTFIRSSASLDFQSYAHNFWSFGFYLFGHPVLF